MSVPESDRVNESKLENHTLEDIIQENVPNIAGRKYSNSGKKENTIQIFLKKSNPKAHNHQIQQG